MKKAISIGIVGLICIGGCFAGYWVIENHQLRESFNTEFKRTMVQVSANFSDALNEESSMTRSDYLDALKKTVDDAEQVKVDIQTRVTPSLNALAASQIEYLSACQETLRRMIGAEHAYLDSVYAIKMEKASKNYYDASLKLRSNYGGAKRMYDEDQVKTDRALSDESSAISSFVSSLSTLVILNKEQEENPLSAFLLDAGLLSRVQARYIEKRQRVDSQIRQGQSN